MPHWITTEEAGQITDNEDGTGFDWSNMHAPLLVIAPAFTANVTLAP